MNKFFKTVLFFILIMLFAFKAQAVETYSVDNKFGLIDGETKITEAKYSKLIRLGNSSYLFLYKNKYGIMDTQGKILVEPKFTQAQRYIGRFVKLGYGGKYALYNEFGEAIADREYSLIDLLYGKMFLVKKNYKYGLISFDGDIILAPTADDIYMPKANVLKISFDGTWYEFEQVDRETIELPKDLLDTAKNRDFKITQIVENPIATTGYGLVSASDYFIKLFSSISPAYEQTIDELILSHGADTALILMKSVWLVKFPFVYGKNYINTLKTPNNGPLANVKTNLKNKMN